MSFEIAGGKMATDKAGRWIKVRSGFGEFEMSQLGPDEKVMASGLHDGGWSVMRNAAERVAGPPEPGTPLTVQNMALKLANSAGLARWEHYLTEWLDSYIDRWKKDEELWHETTEALQAKLSTLEKALRKIIEMSPATNPGEKEGVWGNEDDAEYHGFKSAAWAAGQIAREALK